MEFCKIDCDHLQPTEKEQNRFFENEGFRRAHFCRKYNREVRHNGHHPYLEKLQECEVKP